MSARNVLESQQSVHAAAAGRRPAAGCWKLATGRALSLHPREPGVLEIAQGRVWLTVRGAPSASRPAAEADRVLCAGDRIAIAAGQHVVIEAWTPPGARLDSVAFGWTVAAAGAAQQRAFRPRADWECSVAQPLRELVQALGQGARAVGQAGTQVLGAAGRLLLGVARFALFRIAAPRERTPA